MPSVPVLSHPKVLVQQEREGGPRCVHGEKRGAPSSRAAAPSNSKPRAGAGSSPGVALVHRAHRVLRRCPRGAVPLTVADRCSCAAPRSLSARPRTPWPSSASSPSSSPSSSCSSPSPLAPSTPGGSPLSDNNVRKRYACALKGLCMCIRRPACTGACMAFTLPRASGLRAPGPVLNMQAGCY
jgi:hypothetical protein